MCADLASVMKDHGLYSGARAGDGAGNQTGHCIAAELHFTVYADGGLLRHGGARPHRVQCGLRCKKMSMRMPRYGPILSPCTWAYADAGGWTILLLTTHADFSTDIVVLSLIAVAISLCLLTEVSNHSSLM